jgi:hypothetical protein
MSEVNQNLETLADNLVASLAADAGNQAHTAGIMFIPWMIEPLRFWSAEIQIRWMHGNLLA